MLETSLSICSKGAKGKQINNYLIIKMLGVGQYGKVYKAEDQQSFEIRAIKAIERKRLKRIGGGEDPKVHEIQVLKKMCHRHVVRLHEVIDDPQNSKIFLVMDYLPGGTIADKIAASENGLDLVLVKKYFRQLVSALHYCHEVVNISHRDVKPENMLLDRDGDLILCDFGVSQFFNSENDILKGT